ncbi:Tn7-like element transposition protein TnsE [Acetobacterium wieringae]|uniref:Tn7-like element transposition protein TnsE n=1 Tax=Acetobacterium wieringae TaxID=52694 RepID=UPI0026F2CEAD|nr:Tn7-like element transposition protein TnsE [Acetobacterium wieringae]
MTKKLFKIQWPFEKDIEAQLIWIGDPFRRGNKMMIYGYFNYEKVTEKVLFDWGTLPLLAIQHYYKNGNFLSSRPPSEIKEVEITINQNQVVYSERNWKIKACKDHAISRSFSFPSEEKKIVLPVIEVIRSILATNRFLLYRLFECNSFEQYFIHTVEEDRIYYEFTNQYEYKYTRNSFIYQLTWLLTNDDVLQMFENLAFTWLQNGILKFDWDFKQEIKIKARVKENESYITILQIVNVENMHIPVNEILFSHPHLRKQENSDEAKKYTYNNLNDKNEDLLLNEEVDGATEDFDFVEMNILKHDYISLPKITHEQGEKAQKRSLEDQDTKRFFGNEDKNRSTADVGGEFLARGIEPLMIDEINDQNEAESHNELDDFIRILRILEQQPQIKKIKIVLDNLPIDLRERKFSKLNDGFTNRRYLIAKIIMIDNRQFNIIEIERETYSLSTLILFSLSVNEWDKIYQALLLNLVNDSGTWKSKSLDKFRNLGISIIKAKHMGKGARHGAEMLLKKII